MSTEFYNRNWRMPNSWNGSTDNNNKVSNYSMSFDGSSEFIDTGNSVLNTISATTFSISVWIKVNDVSTDMNGGFGIIITDAPSGNPTNGGFWLGYDDRGGSVSPTEGISYNIKTSTGFQRGRSTNNVITSNTWFHVALVLDGQATLYINGVDVTDRTTDNSGTLETQSNELTIGALDNGSFGYLGSLDHVAIFDYALSASQITTLYGNSTNGVGNPMSLSAKPKAFYAIGDYAAFNGTDYLVNNGALQDYNFNINTANYNQGFKINKDYTYSEFTINIWVNITNALFLGQAVWLNQNSAGTEKIQIIRDSGNDFAAALTGGGNSYYLPFDRLSSSDRPNPTVGRWINLTLVYTGTDIILYSNKVDGTIASVKASDYPAGGTIPTSITLSDNITLIGKLTTGNTSSELKGQFSYVSVFDAALPETGAQSVNSLFNNGTPVDVSSYNNLKGFWAFDAQSTFDVSTEQWTIPDLSANSNNVVSDAGTGFANEFTQNNLIRSNLNITTPYSRYALDFDGTNDYIDCGDALGNSLGACSNASLSVWFKNVNNTTEQGIIAIDKSSFGQGNFTLWKAAAGNIKFGIGGSSYIRTPIASYPAGVWYHIAITYDGSESVITNGVKMYIDGNLINITSSSGSTPASVNFTNENFVIGAAAQNTNTYGGNISNAAIFNSTLTSTQVTEIYSNGKPSNLNNHSAYSNLVSWWQLGENSSFNTNWTVLDEKGTNNGTSVNMGEDAIVNGVGTSANGVTDNMGADENIVGEAPYSTANAISYGMPVTARVSGSGNTPT